MERYRVSRCQLEMSISSEADRLVSSVYSANKAVLADDVGRRLENFFWRIWGNKNIRDQITGSQVATLFSNISEGGFLRTTPTQSPRTSRSLGSYGSTGRLENVAASSPPNANAGALTRSQGVVREGTEEDKAVSCASNEADTLRASKSKVKEQNKDVALPPSILKKPKMASSSQVSKSARISSQNVELIHGHVTGGRDGESDSAEENISSVKTVRNKGKALSKELEPPMIGSSKSSTVSGINSPTVNFSISETINTEEQGTRSQEDERQKSARRSIVAKTAASKRRPTISQRKSSHLSSSNAPNTILSPSSGSKTVSLGKNTVPVSASDELAGYVQSQPAKIPRSGSPHSSKQRMDRAENDVYSENFEEDAPIKERQRPVDGLVDRDFRSKFASRTQIDRHPFVSLPSVTRKSAAAATTFASQQASGSIGFGQSKPHNGKAKRSVEFTDEIIPLKPPGASGLNEETEDRDEDETPNLPRTKSELTLLLEKDKRRTEDGKQSKAACARR